MPAPDKNMPNARNYSERRSTAVWKQRTDTGKTGPRMLRNRGNGNSSVTTYTLNRCVI